MNQFLALKSTESIVGLFFLMQVESFFLRKYFNLIKLSIIKNTKQSCHYQQLLVAADDVSWYDATVI